MTVQTKPRCKLHREALLGSPIAGLIIKFLIIKKRMRQRIQT